VVLPITVIEELDKMKRGNGEIPYSARQALRLLDHYRETGKLSSGVNLPNEGTLRVEIKEDSHLHKQSNDNRIISTAVTIANNGCKGQPVILVYIKMNQNLLIFIRSGTCNRATKYSGDMVKIRWSSSEGSVLS
jgi:PhoH-like ATPase